MNDGDCQIFAVWFHNDREVASGGTPAERYAARTDLPPAERATASRIASAQLGLFRVLSVEPGRSLTLEDIFGGQRQEVTSPHGSREAVRWDLLLAHAMEGDPPSLWGPARTFQPCDEPELRAEFGRIAGASLERLDEPARNAMFRRHALELMRFVPARMTTKPSFFTLEGDPVVFATATWRVRDLSSVTKKLRAFGDLPPDEPVEINITVPRSSLVERRPSLLPPGAVVLESRPLDASESVSIASLRVDGEQFCAEAISEERIAHAIEIVSEDFTELVELCGWKATSVDEALAANRSSPRRPLQTLRESLTGSGHRLANELATEWMHRWLDDPHPQLDGQTPRQAAAGPGRAKVDRLLRQFENNAERAAAAVTRLSTWRGCGTNSNYATTSPPDPNQQAFLGSVVGELKVFARGGGSARDAGLGEDGKPCATSLCSHVQDAWVDRVEFLGSREFAQLVAQSRQAPRSSTSWPATE